MNSSQQLQQLYASLEQSVSDLPLANRSADIVPGEGSSDAEVLFIGEAPGYYEQVERRPFVGRSGKLLRQVIADIQLPASAYFISNIIKVRPPDNRDPFPEEIEAFRSYLNQEIAIIKPQLIVTLGRFSMAKFLPQVRISQVHGRLHRVLWQEKNQYVLPMYHPAAALRSTRTKEQFIADMKKIPKILTWVKEKITADRLRQQITSTLL